MINSFDKFTVREIFGTFIPGLYFTAVLGKIIIPFFDIENDISSFDYFILIIISILNGLIIYSLDFPKKIYFFNNNTPTYLINEKIKSLNLPNTDIDIRNAYFSFYDNSISSSQRLLTEKLTTLFHFTTNTFICSIAILVVELVVIYFNQTIVCSYLIVFNIIVLVLSLISTFGLFYGKNKINNLFKRQYNAFVNSDKYKDLIK